MTVHTTAGLRRQKTKDSTHVNNTIKSGRINSHEAFNCKTYHVGVPEYKR